jgi:hypothetical protein
MLVTAAGIILRLALWDTQTIPSVDGTAYIRIAESFAGGRQVPTVHQYGYPLLIWLAHFGIPDWITAARAVAFVSGASLIPLTWALAAPFVASPWLRLIPAAAMASTPLPIRYSLTTMSDLPYLALFFLMLNLAARKRWMAAGLAGGASYVIRPEGLLATFVVALLQGLKRRGLLQILAGAALFVVPYVVAVGLKDGLWTLTPKTINIGPGTWEAAETQAGEEEVPADLKARVERFGAETLRLYPVRSAEVLIQLVSQVGFVPVLIGPLGLAGPSALLVAGLVHIVFLPLTFIGGRVRYVFPFLPVLWILSVIMIGRLKRRVFQWLLAASLVAGIAVSAWLGRDLYTLNEDGYLPELVEAGRWLKPYVNPSTVVYDRKPYTAFYAGAEGRYTPAGSYDAVLNEISARGGDYLVVNDWVSRSFRPELLPLATDPRVIAAERRVVPIYFTQSERGFRTLIYRIVRSGGPPPFPGEEQIRASVIDLLK